jgi:hypothetical protein
MRFALFREVPRRQRRKKRKLNDGGAARKGEDAEGSHDDSDGSGDELDTPLERMSMPPAGGAAAQARSPRRNQVVQDPIWGDESQDDRMVVEQPPPAVAGPSEDGKIRPERFVIFYHRCFQLGFTGTCCPLGFSSSGHGWQTFLQHDYKTKSRYSYPTFLRPSMRVCLPICYTELRKLRRRARLCRTTKSSCSVMELCTKSNSFVLTPRFVMLYCSSLCRMCVSTDGFRLVNCRLPVISTMKMHLIKLWCDC